MSGWRLFWEGPVRGCGLIRVLVREEEWHSRVADGVAVPAAEVAVEERSQDLLGGESWRRVLEPDRFRALLHCSILEKAREDQP